MQADSRLSIENENNSAIANRGGRAIVTPAFLPGATAHRPQRTHSSTATSQAVRTHPTSESASGVPANKKSQSANEPQTTSTMRHYHLAYQHSMAALSALTSKPNRRKQLTDADHAANALVDMKTNALVKTPFTDVGAVCSMMDDNYLENIHIGFSQPDDMETDTAYATETFDVYDANDLPRWSPESPPPPRRTPNQSPARPPTRLAVPQDAGHLNELHQFVRQDLLEIFVAPPNDDEDCAYYGGRVGLRCVHCSTIRRNKAARSAFFPKRLRTIYTEVSSWQQVRHK